MEKKIAIIGIGNCGSQVANLAEEKYGTLIDSVYINTSAADLSQVKGAIKFKVGDEDDIEGSGKNRSKMKEYLRENLQKILTDEKFDDLISDKKYVFIVASAAGGTGSGAAPILLEILKNCYLDAKFILVAVLPQLQASLMEQGNTIEFLNELYNDMDDETTYMIYDNETTAGTSPTESLSIVNENIVEDIRILTGIDNFATPYDSIDEADMESIICTPGRLLIVRITNGLTEKVLEDALLDDLIIKTIKKSCHAETDRNKRVVRWGVITYFTDEVNKLYNASFEKVHDFIGTPVERFNHNAINDKGEEFNFFYLLASGLSPINDRIKRINDRIEKLQKALAGDDKKKSILDGGNVSYNASEMRQKEAKKQRADKEINPLALFDSFGKKNK